MFLQCGLGFEHESFVPTCMHPEDSRRVLITFCIYAFVAHLLPAEDWSSYTDTKERHKVQQGKDTGYLTPQLVQVPELEPGWSAKPDFSHILDKVSRCQATIGKVCARPCMFASKSGSADA